MEVVDHSISDFDQNARANCRIVIQTGLAAFNEAEYPDPRLWIDEQHRGKGLGTVLLTTAEGIAVNRGCHGLRLDTDKGIHDGAVLGRHRTSR